MRTTNEGSTVTLELDKDETLERHVLQATVTKAVLDPNLWSVFLIVTPELANVNKVSRMSQFAFGLWFTEFFPDMLL